MKRLFLFLLVIVSLVTISRGQNQFPNLDTSALVTNGHDLKEVNKPYTLIIYGGVGCGYSKYLIDNLDVLEECRTKCDILLIMDQPKDHVIRHMKKAADTYPTFTNTILQYQLKKKNNFFPQLLIFKNKAQIHHVIGIKEGMLSKVKQLIMEDK